MVTELDIKDQDVNKIADMIDSEITTLVPEWKASFWADDDSHLEAENLYHTRASTGPMLDYMNASHTDNLQILEGSNHGCAEVHGRFEEITYRDSRISSSQLDGAHFTDIWAQRESNSKIIHCDDAHEMLGKLTIENDDERIIKVDDRSKSSYSGRKCYSVNPQSPALEDYQNEIRQELRWLKAKYQMQLREIRDQQLGVPSPSSNSARPNQEADNDGLIWRTLSPGKCSSLKFAPDGRCANAVASGSLSPERMVTAKSFYTSALLPQPLHRATSLPVDAVDF